jgi:hypothetical protein
VSIHSTGTDEYICKVSTVAGTVAVEAGHRSGRDSAPGNDRDLVTVGDSEAVVALVNGDSSWP